MLISAVEVAACVESVATAWHAVKRANFNRGDTVLILGGGPVSPLNRGGTMGIYPYNFIDSFIYPSCSSVNTSSSQLDIRGSSTPQFALSNVFHPRIRILFKTTNSCSQTRCIRSLRSITYKFRRNRSHLQRYNRIWCSCGLWYDRYASDGWFCFIMPENWGDAGEYGSLEDKCDDEHEFSV